MFVIRGDAALALLKSCKHKKSCVRHLAHKNLGESRTRSGRKFLKPSSFVAIDDKTHNSLTVSDREHAAKALAQKHLLLKCITSWKIEVRRSILARSEPTKKNMPNKSAHNRKRKRTIKKENQILPKGQTGLRNLGQTCYMNVVLQALGNVPSLRILLTAIYNESAKSDSLSGPVRKKHCRRDTLSIMNSIESAPSPSNINERKYSHGSMMDFQSSLRITTDLGKLYKVMFSGKCSVISPVSILNTVWATLPWFRGHSQQDAQELLCTLLGRMEEELDDFVATASPHSLDVIRSYIVQIKNEIFYSRLSSTVKCKTCGNRSETIEPFLDLSLDIPMPPITRRGGTARTKSANNMSVTIESILKNYVSTEELGGKIYNCSRCNLNGKSKNLQPASKTVALSQVANVLRFHIKRFVMTQTG
eukprot:UC4_evm1s1204